MLLMISWYIIRLRLKSPCTHCATQFVPVILDLFEDKTYQRAENTPQIIKARKVCEGA